MSGKIPKLCHCATRVANWKKNTNLWPRLFFIRSNPQPPERPLKVMLKGCILVKAKIKCLFFLWEIYTSPPRMPMDTGFGYITSKTSNVSFWKDWNLSQKGQGILQTVSFQMFLWGLRRGYDLILKRLINHLPKYCWIGLLHKNSSARNDNRAGKFKTDLGINPKNWAVEGQKLPGKPPWFFHPTGGHPSRKLYTLED